MKLRSSTSSVREGDVVDKVQLKIEKSKIYRNLDILDDREKEVAVGRFGLELGGEERTQREIAKELDADEHFGVLGCCGSWGLWIE
ncbi:DNA-directed RNA polymerase specialized sigma subunit [Bacillus sp. 3255]|nr:DNA-directed RNA polymerase specialized sigma subunit [Bacillus sp. 3255]